MVLQMKRNKSKPVYILDGVRTPTGNPYKSLKNYTAAQLGAAVVKAIIKRNKVSKKDIEEVIIGNAVSAGLGQNLACQISFLAGLPVNIPCFTVNNVCGSGLQSVVLASRAIRGGDIEVCLAGGAESATHSPYLVSREDAENYSGDFSNLTLADSILKDGLCCSITNSPMGELIEKLTRTYKISREEQDFFSLNSHQKAAHALESGKLDNEMISLKSDKNKKILKDDRPRKKMQMEVLSRLPPVFWTGGSVTAGNSSIACDGASLLLLASQNYVERYRLKPLAGIRHVESAAGDPKKTFEMTWQAIKNCLDHEKFSVDDIDLFEISEAFAAQVILTQKKLKIPNDRLNIYGGDVACGHPLGAAGARALVTLAHALHTENKKRGLVCISFGGGGSIAIIIERV